MSSAGMMIRSRYESRCRLCGGSILPGTAMIYHRDGGRGRKAEHIECGEQQSPRIVVTRYSSGAESFRNAAGLCEDAPCCGCCSS